MRKLKTASMLLLSAVLALGLTGCGESQETASSNSGGSAAEPAKEASSDIQERTIKISFSTAENTPKDYGSKAFKKYIEEASGGKIKVQIFPNSSLFGDKDEYDNLIANNVQFIIPDMVKLSGYNPAFNISAMPFIFSSDEAANKFWDGPKGQEILKSLEPNGALGVAQWPNGSKSVTNNVRSIKTPQDFKGLKFRIPGGEVIEKTYKALGASSVSLPFDELFMALQQGTVDGQENTFSNIETKKFDEVQKYMTISNHNRIDYALLTNTKFWNDLNEPTKKIVEEAIKIGTEEARAKAKALNEEAIQKIKERGNIEIYELSKEEVEKLREATKPVYDEFGKVMGEDVIKEALSY